jgi:4-amino-4-deoxy-L-arabinose transferase-like glycosyltransferase
MAASPRRAVRLILTAILLVAAVWRLATVHFGLPALNNPDELFFELGAVKMLRGPTLDPGWFGHPATITFYALAVIDVLVFGVGWLTGWFASPAGFAKAIYLNPSWVILPGRIMIVCFGLLVIALTYRLGERLFGSRSGLAAAAILALAPVHVVWSQIIRSDMMACAFMLLSMLAALRVAREGRWRDTMMAAIWLAAAVACKWPFAVGAMAMAGAAALRWHDHPKERMGEFWRLVAFAVSSLVALVAMSPYLLISWRSVISDVTGEDQPYHLGASGGSIGWNTLWYLDHPLLASFGVAGLAAAALGLILVWRRRDARAILLPVAIVFSAVVVSQHIVWERWVLPLLPILAIAAGHAAIWFHGRVTAVLARRWKEPVAFAVGIALGLAPLSTDVARGRELTHDTRQEATQWLMAHAPRGSSVMIEQFSFDLVGKGYALTFPAGDAGCLDVEKGLDGQISFDRVQRLHSGRTNIDYGTLAPDKVSTCAADFAIVSQYDRYAAERRRFPRETAQYEALLARGKTLAVFRPESGRVGGPVVRVVAFGSAGKRGG